MCPATTDPPFDWRQEAINGGSLRHVDLHSGSNGWSSPPGDLFSLRAPGFFSRRKKLPAGSWLLSPAGVDWLRSPHRLDNLLSRPDHRVSSALRRAHSQNLSLKSFIFAVNLQLPAHHLSHSAVFYFSTDDPIPPGSLLHRFIHADDAFRNSRFKLVSRILKGPWILKAAVANHSACLLGKALLCNYHKGDNYFEVDVDIGSSAIAAAILKLALGCLSSVSIDMGFVVEAQAEDELPEKLIGAVRIAQMEMSAAAYVEPPAARAGFEQRRGGPVRVGQEREDEEEG